MFLVSVFTDHIGLQCKKINQRNISSCSCHSLVKNRKMLELFLKVKSSFMAVETFSCPVKHFSVEIAFLLTCGLWNIVKFTGKRRENSGDSEGSGGTCSNGSSGSTGNRKQASDQLESEIQQV